MKLLFTDNLHNILKETYYLTHHAGFTADYVDSLVPFDRGLYWAYFLEEQKETQKEPGHYTALDNNIPGASNTQGIM